MKRRRDGRRYNRDRVGVRTQRRGAARSRHDGRGQSESEEGEDKENWDSDGTDDFIGDGFSLGRGNASTRRRDVAARSSRGGHRAEDRGRVPRRRLRARKESSDEEEEDEDWSDGDRGAVMRHRKTRLRRRREESSEEEAGESEGSSGYENVSRRPAKRRRREGGDERQGGTRGGANNNNRRRLRATRKDAESEDSTSEEEEKAATISRSRDRSVIDLRTPLAPRLNGTRRGNAITEGDEDEAFIDLTKSSSNKKQRSTKSNSSAVSPTSGHQEEIGKRKKLRRLVSNRGEVSSEEDELVFSCDEDGDNSHGRSKVQATSSRSSSSSQRITSSTNTNIRAPPSRGATRDGSSLTPSTRRAIMEAVTEMTPETARAAQVALGFTDSDMASLNRFKYTGRRR